MAEAAKSDSSDKSESKETGKGDAVKKVEDQIEKENEQGYRGIQVDETPNENYTVKGVTSGKPTPETEKGQEPGLKPGEEPSRLTK